MSSHPSLGKRLARAREDAGLDQDMAAQAVGMHPVTLSRYENDKRPAPAEVRQKLAVLYGLPDDTFDDAPAMQQPAATGPAGQIATREIPLHVLTYWRGIIETEHRHLTGLTQSMAAMLDMLRDTTQGIGGFIDSGVLPMPSPDPEAQALVDRARTRAHQELARMQTPPRQTAEGA